MKLKTEVCADSLLNYSDHWVSCTTYLKLTQSKSTLNRTHTKKIVSPLKKKRKEKKKKGLAATVKLVLRNNSIFMKMK